MKILILCDHYPLSPRVNKIRNSLITIYPNCIVKVFAWNRNNREVNEEYVDSYNQDLGYGNRYKKLLNLPWFIHEAKNFAEKFKPDYVHSIDFEMLIASIFNFHKTKIVYEVYDIKFFTNKFINKVREQIEFLTIKKHVYGMILASPYFDIYYTNNSIIDIKKITINNKPSRLSNVNVNDSFMKQYEDIMKTKIVVGFIGTIRYEEILLNLINASKHLDNIIILISGDGPASEYVKNYIKVHELEFKVIMTGRYNSEDLASIYESCDYVWAAYPNKDLNVKYAISNKFFESIVFKKKLIVSDSTMLGDSVNELKIGYTINPYNTDKISNLLGRLNKYDYGDDRIIFEDGLYWEDEEKKLLSIYLDSKINVKGEK